MDKQYEPQKVEEQWKTIKRRKQISLEFAYLNFKEPEKVLDFFALKSEENQLPLADHVVIWLRNKIADEKMKNHTKVVMDDETEVKIQNDAFDESTMVYQTDITRYDPQGFFDYLTIHSHYLHELQHELQEIVKSIKRLPLEYEKKRGEIGIPFFNSSLMHEEQERKLLKKLNAIQYKVVLRAGNKKMQSDSPLKSEVHIQFSIQLVPENFEQMIYKNFMEYLNEQQGLYFCTNCTEVIIQQPTRQQLNNFQRNGVILHDNCRPLYKSMRSTERKQKSRLNKASHSKEELL